jgi:arylsulfatase
MVPLRAPNIFNLRTDPFEKASEDATVFYGKWMADRTFLLVPAQAIVGEFLKSFQEFPPRAKAASFSVDQAMEKLMPKDTGAPPKEEVQEPKVKKTKAELEAAHN